MSINLSKRGTRVNLAKDVSGLKNVVVGLGWTKNMFDTGSKFDLDASAFLLGADDKCSCDKDFIFYNNAVNENESVVYSGDNRVGGDGSDVCESIIIHLDDVPSSIHKIVFTVTIDAAEERGQNFGQVDNAFIRLTNEDTGVKELEYNLAEDYSLETALVIAELYRVDGGWGFKAVGAGFNGGLAALCTRYGLDVR